MMKILTASVLGVIGVAASTVALAETNASTYCKPGFYAGIQGGRGDTFYHANDVMPQTAVSVTDPIFDITVSEGVVNQQVDDIGISGRLYGGYQFNPYFALETGFTQFNKTDFSGDAYVIVDDVRLPAGTVSGEITERAVDLVGKATLPLQYGFGLYAKAGLALITSDRHTTEVPTGITFDTNSYQAVRPTYGAGIDYTIPNTALDVEVFYSEIAGRGLIKTASLWGGGLAYKFA
jgi:hypothetical protein